MKTINIQFSGTDDNYIGVYMDEDKLGLFLEWLNSESNVSFNIKEKTWEYYVKRDQITYVKVV